MLDAGGAAFSGAATGREVQPPAAIQRASCLRRLCPCSSVAGAGAGEPAATTNLRRALVPGRQHDQPQADPDEPEPASVHLTILSPGGAELALRARPWWDREQVLDHAPGLDHPRKWVKLFHGSTELIPGVSLQERGVADGAVLTLLKISLPEYLATSSTDGEIKIWSTFDWSCARTLRGDRGWVDCVAFSSDGRYLAAGYNTGAALLWNVAANCRLAGALKGHGDRVACVAFPPPQQPSILATASWDCTAKLWDVESGRCRHTLLGHSGPATSAAFLQHGGLCIATASEDRTVRIWNAETGSWLRTLEGCNGGVNSLAYGLQLAIASNEVVTWEARRPGMRVLRGRHSGWVASVAVSPDGQKLATASSEGTAEILLVATGQQIVPPLRGHKGRVTSVAFSHAGDLLATASEDHTTRVWYSANGDELTTLEGHNGMVTCAAFSPPVPHDGAP